MRDHDCGFGGKIIDLDTVTALVGDLFTIRRKNKAFATASEEFFRLANPQQAPILPAERCCHYIVTITPEHIAIIRCEHGVVALTQKARQVLTFCADDPDFLLGRIRHGGGIGRITLPVEAPAAHICHCDAGARQCRRLRQFLTIVTRIARQKPGAIVDWYEIKIPALSLASDKSKRHAVAGGSGWINKGRAKDLRNGEALVNAPCRGSPGTRFELDDRPRQPLVGTTHYLAREGDVLAVIAPGGIGVEVKGRVDVGNLRGRQVINADEFPVVVWRAIPFPASFILVSYAKP